MNDEIKKIIADFDSLGNSPSTDQYIKSYWVTKQEYPNVKNVLSKVFDLHKVFPELPVRDGFEISVLLNDVLFDKDEYEMLQKFISYTRDKTIYAFQYYVEEYLKLPGPPIPIKVKYPIGLPWEKINIKNESLSFLLYELSLADYYVFGDSGVWGKYSANEFFPPLQVYAYRPEFTDIFVTCFKNAIESSHIWYSKNKKEYDELIPDFYKTFL